jgi:Protein of unknown function (DUF2508).
MFFRRKKGLKQEFDERLLSQMERMKRNWERERLIVANSLGNNEDLHNQMRIAERKYFYLFKEAKARNLRVEVKHKG